MGPRSIAFLGAAALVVMSSEAARADGNQGGYGERIVAVDLASDAVIIAGLYAESDWPLYAGLAGHVLGGPIVHLAHDRAERAALSLGVRVGLPALGGVIGQAVCFDDGGFLKCLGSTATGIIVGLLAAQVVDPLLIVPDEPPTPAMLTFRF